MWLDPRPNVSQLRAINGCHLAAQAGRGSHNAPSIRGSPPKITYEPATPLIEYVELIEESIVDL